MQRMAKKIHVTVTGPLGERVKAYYGILGNGQTAIIEMAQASGLAYVPQEKKERQKRLRKLQLLVLVN